MSYTYQELEQRIRERAYALWEADGRPEGKADEYWERAREMIAAEEASGAVSMSDPPPL